MILHNQTASCALLCCLCGEKKENENKRKPEIVICGCYADPKKQRFFFLCLFG